MLAVYVFPYTYLYQQHTREIPILETFLLFLVFLSPKYLVTFSRDISYGGKLSTTIERTLVEPLPYPTPERYVSR